MSKKRVAVIGAGASSLAAIKCCLDEGLEPDCIERTSHVGGLWYYQDDVFDGQGHRRRNRGGEGKGALAPPHFPGRGGGRRSPSPHFWASTYLKVPLRSLFFHPHNFTVLTPNQSVRRCFEKFIDVGTGGGGAAGEPSPPPQCFSSVCVWGGALMLEAPSGQFFSVQRYNILHNRCIYHQPKNKP